MPELRLKTAAIQEFKLANYKQESALLKLFQYSNFHQAEENDW